MGNCAGYCNGAGEGTDDGQHQIRQSFNKQDMMNNQHNDFENRYGRLRFETQQTLQVQRHRSEVRQECENQTSF